MKSLLITDNLRELVKTERAKRNLSGADLSKYIGKKSNNFISLLENKGIDKIKIEDLRNLLKVLLNYTDSDIDNYIESMLNNNDDLNQNETSSEPPESSNTHIPKATCTCPNCKGKFDVEITQERFDLLTSRIVEGFNAAFKHDSERSFSQLTAFFMNMAKWDLSFMMALIRIPFFELGDVPIEKKQILYKEISNIFQKYLSENEAKDSFVKDNI